MTVTAKASIYTGGWVIVAITMMAGCGSPMVRWKDPDKGQAEHTMAYAKAYTNNARKAYQQAADTQVERSSNLGAGLIGLGGAIAGLAAFGASGDAITGTALLGGTAYALGNWSTSRQRQLVYLAGVEAIDCAEEVMAPFDVSASKRKTFRERLNELEKKLAASARASNRVRQAQMALANDEGSKQLQAEAERLLAESRTAAGAGRDVLDRGQDIDGRIDLAGGDLVRVVNRIGTAVDKAVLDTVPDLAAVKTVIGAIPSFAGIFAPGSGVEGRISTALGKAEGGIKIQSRMATPADAPLQKELKAALDELEASTDALDIAAGLAKNATPKIPDTKDLTKCGINVNFAFTATPATVEMKGGVVERYTVFLAGGTKPYFAYLQGPTAKGLTVTAPFPNDRAVAIEGNSELTGGQQFKVLAVDASDPPKSILFVINVAGAPSNGTKGQGGTPPANQVESRMLSVVPFTLDDVHRPGLGPSLAQAHIAVALAQVVQVPHRAR